MRYRLTAAAMAALVAVAACDTTEPLKPGAMTSSALAEQSAVVGTAVPTPPAVRVTTASGKPVAGVEVTFVTLGGGSLTGAVARTDVNGVAAASTWTLGTAVGTQEVIATTAVLPGVEVRFRAFATAGEPRQLSMWTQPPATATAGAPVTPPPAVQLLDQYGNAAPVPGIVVSAVIDGSVTLANASARTDDQGIATFSGLTIAGAPGTYSLQFTAPSLTTAFAANAVLLLADPAQLCTGGPLSLQLGEVQRYRITSSSAPHCLRFTTAANAGQQFMLLVENMPLHGGYDSGIFPGAVGDTALALNVRFRPAVAAAAVHAAVRAHASASAANETHTWDFGAGRIYELEPDPAAHVPEPQLLRGGRMMSLQDAATAPQVGDTIEVRMEAISRLNIAAGNQKAVIRFISSELIIAEDVRLGTTLRRQSGGFNTPLSATDLANLAGEYAAIARVQGDIIFENRFNTAIEAKNPPRVLAVHSLMPADNIWGYTYSSGDYFVWDFWVGTDGVTRGRNQEPHRIADNLIMHEIAHMRHWGLLQRNGSPPRGNRWLVEGFARHTERWSIANRLLGVVSPSRTSNVVLPRNPLFGTAYFRDDVPTFLNAGTSMFGGYQHSSFVFDYFMDQVAYNGGDHVAALRDLVINAGRQETLDAAVARWLPGLTFPELFTRARIALYLDDIGTAGLPPWTQYHMYQLRDSRPAGDLAESDPRNAWPLLAPGSTSDVEVRVGKGAAYGLIIDGTSAAAGNGFVLLDGPHATPNGVISITRIR